MLLRSNNANVGTGKTVTVTGYTSPSSNYTLTQPSFTANITAAPLTITADNVIKSAGTALASPGAGSTAFSSSGLIGTETVGSVTINYTGGNAAGDAAGVYSGTVVPSAATGGTFNASNYTITYVNGDMLVGSFRYAVANGNWNSTSVWSKIGRAHV